MQALELELELVLVLVLRILLETRRPQSLLQILQPVPVPALVLVLALVNPSCQQNRLQSHLQAAPRSPQTLRQSYHPASKPTAGELPHHHHHRPLGAWAPPQEPAD